MSHKNYCLLGTLRKRIISASSKIIIPKSGNQSIKVLKIKSLYTKTQFPLAGKSGNDHN
jgi:hypothetical protein